MIARIFLISLSLVTVLFGSNQTSANSLKNDRSECYGYLTELVRSSSFPFTYVVKDKANLLIDEDNGEIISAQVVFDTDGSGTIGWVQYNIQTHELLNTSAELEIPESLVFENKYAEQYDRCIRDQ